MRGRAPTTVQEWQGLEARAVQQLTAAKLRANDAREAYAATGSEETHTSRYTAFQTAERGQATVRRWRSLTLLVRLLLRRAVASAAGSPTGAERSADEDVVRTLDASLADADDSAPPLLPPNIIAWADIPGPPRLYEPSMPSADVLAQALAIHLVLAAHESDMDALLLCLDAGADVERRAVDLSPEPDSSDEEENGGPGRRAIVYRPYAPRGEALCEVRDRAPLAAAVEAANADSVRVLLQHGADPAASQISALRWGWPHRPMSPAQHAQVMAVVTALVAAGLDVRGPEGAFALGAAVRASPPCPQGVCLYLDAGAPLDTVLDRVDYGEPGHMALMTMLVGRGADARNCTAALCAATAALALPAMEALLTAGADPNAHAGGGMPVHALAEAL
jgi:hypothetical protein